MLELPVSKIGLMTPSVGFRPMRYGWAYDMWKQQNRVHWMVEEIPFGEDIRDWNNKLTKEEKNLLTQIFRFFVEADVEVADNYHENLSQVFKPTEVKMMLASFAAMEATHIDAYAHLIDTIGLPETEYSAFLNYKAMKDKQDYLTRFNVETPEDTALTLAVFGGFVEGLQLFASFSMLMNFPRFNLMKSMGQVVTWSIRDESLHCQGIIRLFKEFCREQWGSVPDGLVNKTRDVCRDIIDLEDAFIDQAFELGGVKGMEPSDIKRYTRYIADWRLEQLGIPTLFGIKDHPLPWLVPLLNGVEHGNFFEVRTTEYSKGATQGSWQDVWSAIDTNSAAAV